MPATRRSRVSAALAAAAGIGVVLFGPWWDLGFESAADTLCFAFVRDELTDVTTVRGLVPAGIGCRIDGRPVAAEGAGIVQAGLLVYAAALTIAALRGLRVTGAVVVTALFALGGYAAFELFEGVVTVTGVVILGPPLALAVLAAAERPSRRTWIVLVVATWIGYGAAWVLWAAGTPIAVVVPVGAIAVTGLDALGRTLTSRA